ncbi:hypothetical protein [Mesorhizobium sp. M2A.F.Ca.ET.039.01.1.1]|uniref:hypothetical protein n=1 Tax=Mesorhizobium sp. M2A.F.Ca.ET.039.01.1.1 TaxID=2496746 RepID=UPI000FCBCBDE|nr:hypothetical protein [Mesorhizobium sp. M2A.F.Ca.ET.039.01.1.1]RWX72566.1 hypothetical protein EOA24_00820 [Mesorhizobium sp. M2A.F.Ca.ET.039.01.1.1]
MAFHRNRKPASFADVIAEEELHRLGGRPKKAAALITYTQTASEVIRLHKLGRSREQIASLLRMPYREIEAALALA